MELLAEPVIVTCSGEGKVVGRAQIVHGIGVTKRYSYVSTSPLMYSIALPNPLPLTELLKSSGHFVVHWPKDEKLIRWVEEAQLRPDVAFERTASETIESDRLKNCETYMECEVVQSIPCGDHTLFIANVRKRVL
jgi:flavin reductase (DIM6/NTAB) family NADH-FMN oxidoreductase RutF